MSGAQIICCAALTITAAFALRWMLSLRPLRLRASAFKKPRGPHCERIRFFR